MKLAWYSLLFFSLTQLCPAQSLRPVRLMTTDDIGISAMYYAVPAEKAPAVLLLHSAEQNRDVWNSFAPLLQRVGIAVLTMDLRGHGQSTRQITAYGPRLVSYKSFTTNDYPLMLLDIEAAVSWLGKQSEIDNHRIGVMGAGVGANLALRYAAINSDIAGIAMLSPGINYRGVRTDDAIHQVGSIPMLITVSQLDNIAYQSSKELVRLRKEDGRETGLELLPSTGNLFGTEMLTGVKGLPERLIQWWNQTLRGIPSSPSPSRNTLPASPPSTPAP